MIFVEYYYLFHEHLIRKGDMNRSIFATELFLQYWWMHQQNVEVFPTPNLIIQPRYALEPPWDLHVKQNLLLIYLYSYSITDIFSKIYIQIQELPLASTTKDLRLFKILLILIRWRRFPLPSASSPRTKCARIPPLMVSVFTLAYPHMTLGYYTPQVNSQSALKESVKITSSSKFEMSRKLQKQYLFMTFLSVVFLILFFKKRIWGVVQKLPHVIIIYTKRIARLSLCSSCLLAAFCLIVNNSTALQKILCVFSSNWMRTNNDSDNLLWSQYD